MNFQKLAHLTISERAEYINAAAVQSGLSDFVIEKDFWVVWILEHLFALSREIGPFTFKGGTSLSKGFNVIQRFSEDIDISISRATLGFADDAYFYTVPSAKERKRRVDKIRDKVRSFTIDSILPALRRRLNETLSGKWALEVSEPASLRFRYPTSQLGVLGYLRPDVLLEFGHADN